MKNFDNQVYKIKSIICFVIIWCLVLLLVFWRGLTYRTDIQANIATWLSNKINISVKDCWIDTIFFIIILLLVVILDFTSFDSYIYNSKRNSCEHQKTKSKNNK